MVTVTPIWEYPEEHSRCLLPRVLSREVFLDHDSLEPHSKSSCSLRCLEAKMITQMDLPGLHLPRPRQSSDLAIASYQKASPTAGRLGAAQRSPLAPLASTTLPWQSTPFDSHHLPSVS